jgi:hypothetical protein
VGRGVGVCGRIDPVQIMRINTMKIAWLLYEEYEDEGGQLIREEYPEFCTVKPNPVRGRVVQIVYAEIENSED